MNVFHFPAIDEEEKTEEYYLRAIEHAESYVNSVKETIEELRKEWLESRENNNQEQMKAIENDFNNKRKELRFADKILFTKTSEHFERFGRGTSIFGSTSECQPSYIDDEINTMLQLLESKPYDEKVKYTYEIKEKLQEKYPDLNTHINYAFKFYILSFKMVKEHDLFRDNESVPPLMIYPEVRSIHLTVQLIRFLCIIPDFHKALAEDDSLKNTDKSNSYLLDEHSKWFEILIAFFVYYCKIRSIIRYEYIEELLVILSESTPEINHKETIDLLKKRIQRLILLLTKFETFDSFDESNPSDNRTQSILKKIFKIQQKKKAKSVPRTKGQSQTKRLLNQQKKEKQEENKRQQEEISSQLRRRNSRNFSSALLSIPGGKKTKSKRKHKSKTRRI